MILPAWLFDLSRASAPQDGQHVAPLWALMSSSKTVRNLAAGNVASVSAVRFSTCLFKLKDRSKDGEAAHTIAMAIGSADGSVSLWSERQREAIVVLNRVFESGVTDLAW